MATLDFTPWPKDIAASYRERGFWIEKPLTDILEVQRFAHPDRVALVGSEQALTFQHLSDQAFALARVLWLKGLRPGDKAVVQLPNIPVFYVTYWALLTIGVRPVFSLFNHSSLELTGFSKQLKPKLLILSGKHPLFAKDDEYLSALKTVAGADVVLFSELNKEDRGHLSLEAEIANAQGCFDSKVQDERKDLEF